MDGPHPHFSIGQDRGLGLGVRVALKVGAQTLDFILSTTSSYLVLFLLIKIIIKKVTLVSGPHPIKRKILCGFA